MSDLGRCDQQKFTRAALVDRLSVPREQIGSFITLATQFKTSHAEVIDVEVGLSVLTQTLCVGLGVDNGEVVHAYRPFMNAALLHLASNPAHWRFERDDDTAVRSRLFGEGEGAGLRRRSLQELLGGHERPTHRYLVRRPGERWSGNDDLGDKLEAGAEPMILSLDAAAVADRFSGALSGPFFSWQA